MTPLSPPLRVVVMGVAGSGKTTLGRALAQELHVPFLDGDDFHSPGARARMHAGHPLADEERAPWLTLLRAQLDTHDHVILACSALKHRYRDALRAPGTHFMYLDVPAELLRDRLHHRRGHYAGADLLPSQLATLEVPRADEPDTITLHVTARHTPADVLREALSRLQT